MIYRVCQLVKQAVFSTGRDIASITHLEVKCLLFFHGSETNVPTYFLSVQSTGRQLRTWRSNVSFFSMVVRQMSPPISCLCRALGVNYALGGQMSPFFPW